MSDQLSVGGVAHTPEHLGRIVALRRRHVGLTQGALAERAGVPRRFVNELEAGLATIYVRRLFATLDALGYRVVLEPTSDPGEIPAPALADVGW